jgi:NAD(P)H-dependent flavin oxidoreductase YrpB (nitropropane dioxygenase family)
MVDLGRPFWLAGAQARASNLREAIEVGAAGIQVGTVFALCRESGLDDGIKRRLIDGVMAGDLEVFTDPVASPTGFPFKVVQGLDDTLASETPYVERQRVCDLGYLRSAYRRPGGKLGYRCAAEPERAFVKKGGDPADAVGRKCLCNALLGNIGLPQVRKDGRIEKPLVTSGDDLEIGVRRLVERYGRSYAAADVIDDLLGGSAGRDGVARKRDRARPRSRRADIPTNA